MSRSLYPRIKAYQSESLITPDGNHLYLEQSGNPDGIPVLYIHGGPGGGASENHRRYFDPDKYRIIIFDQRGCGRSTPFINLAQNSTDKLLEDIESIRQHLAITKWLVVAGSWGTTLALCYGIKHPDNVLAFILRGTFLATQKEYHWLYSRDGAARFFPEYYQEFIEPLAYCDKENPIAGYHKIFSCDNEVAVAAASKAWYLWELRLSTIEHHHIGMSQVEDTHQALTMAQLSNHYFYHKSFLPENYIINHIDAVSHIPGILIHGRYDMVCQLAVAAELAQVWQNARLQILPQAGHSGFESQTIDAMCKATDTMANFLAEKEQ